jgi:hypothetical protein
MLAVPNPDQQLRTLAWYGLGLVASYFCLASVALRWRPLGGVRVPRYEPPSGVSPALAAYLLERGTSDKPFVVAILSMAAKGYLKIEQGPEDYLLARTDPSVPLDDEESVIAERLFSSKMPEICLANLHKLGKTAREVRNSLESAAEPDLVSPNFPFFVPGVTVSLWCFLAALYPEMEGLWKSNFGAMLTLPAFVAVWALLATIRTLPVMLFKLRSLIFGGDAHSVRFVKADRNALITLLVAIACLGVIGWASSWQFAALFGLFIVVNLVGLIALRAPTAAGHKLLGQLSDFRTFLVAVEGDPVNRLNPSNAPSATALKYWAWALALDVERAWGAQFAATVLNRLEPDAAMVSIENNCPEDDRAKNEILDLHLR